MTYLRATSHAFLITVEVYSIFNAVRANRIHFPMEMDEINGHFELYRRFKIPKNPCQYEFVILLNSVCHNEKRYVMISDQLDKNPNI